MSQFQRQAAKRKQEGLEKPKDDATPKQGRKRLKRKFSSVFTERASQHNSRKSKNAEEAEKSKSTDLSSPPKKKQRFGNNNSQET